MALMIRPNFNMADEGPVLVDAPEGGNIGPEQLLSAQLEKYGNEDVITFSKHLYRLLAKEKKDEAGEIINQFYNEHYATVTEEVELTSEDVEEEPQEKEDIQTTLGED